MLSRKKIALIHIACKQFNFTEEQFRELLARVGVKSAKDLSEDQFDLLMWSFEQSGFQSEFSKRGFGFRPGMASPDQVELIRKLWREWSEGDDPRALDHWLERSYHVTTLRFLSRETASNAINGLRAMLRRKRGPSAA